MRRERDSSSVLKDEEMRERAALSGAMLKFVMVWAMSCKKNQSDGFFVGNTELPWQDLRQGAWL